jgi:hypothetical protein
MRTGSAPAFASGGPRARRADSGRIASSPALWPGSFTLVDGIFLEAYPSRRFQSAWMGIIVHSSASIFALIVVLTLVT